MIRWNIGLRFDRNRGLYRTRKVRNEWIGRYVCVRIGTPAMYTWTCIRFEGRKRTTRFTNKCIRGRTPHTQYLRGNWPHRPTSILGIEMSFTESIATTVIGYDGSDWIAKQRD